MNESILTTIKKLLGIDAEYTQFDTDIIIHINTVFNILSQMGYRPFSISDSSTKWGAYLRSNSELNLIRSYMYMKVRSFFDPPAGSVATALDNSIKELEWRISVTLDPED